MPPRRRRTARDYVGAARNHDLATWATLASWAATRRTGGTSGPAKGRVPAWCQDAFGRRRTAVMSRAGEVARRCLATPKAYLRPATSV